MNGNSKGGYSLKTNNSGGTPGGTSRVHKIDSLTPYQNRYNKKNIQRSEICVCTVSTIQLHELHLYVCRSPKFTVLLDMNLNIKVNVELKSSTKKFINN